MLRAQPAIRSRRHIARVLVESPLSAVVARGPSSGWDPRFAPPTPVEGVGSAPDYSSATPLASLPVSAPGVSLSYVEGEATPVEPVRRLHVGGALSF